jgi:hypothetical protein
LRGTLEKKSVIDFEDDDAASLIKSIKAAASTLWMSPPF